MQAPALGARAPDGEGGTHEQETQLREARGYGQTLRPLANTMVPTKVGHSGVGFRVHGYILQKSLAARHTSRLMGLKGT